MARFPQDALIDEQYGRLLTKQEAAGDDALEARGVEWLKKALALDDSLAMPNYQLGYLALERGEVELALRRLEKAVKLEPDVSKIPYSLARTYRRPGRSAEASEQLTALRRSRAVEE